MYQTIPKNMYKRVDIDKNITVTGYKSRSYDYNFKNGNSKGVINHDRISLTIENSGSGSSFKLNISSRKNIEKLKEAVDFALEIKKEKND